VNIGILNVDTLKPEFVENFGDYPAMFTQRLHALDPTIETVAYNAQEGDYPTHIDAHDGYIITGSKLGVYDDLPWIEELMGFIRLLHAKKKKLMGICFGHQVIAEALGGKTGKAEGGWCAGVYSNQLSEEAKQYGINEVSVNLISSHQDQVQVPADGAIVLASNEFCPFAMTAIDNHILTMQPHFEFTPAFVNELIEMRRHILGEKIYNRAKDSLGLETDHHKVTRWVIDFFKKKP